MPAGIKARIIKEGKHAGVITVGILEGSSEMGLTMDEYESLSIKEQELKKEEVRERYLEAGADFVIDKIDGILI